MSSIHRFTAGANFTPPQRVSSSSPVQFGMSQPASDTVSFKASRQALLNRLRVATQNNSLEEVNTALNTLPTDPAKRADIINTSDENSEGNTLLHEAATAGNAEIVRALIEHGASLTSTDNDLDTPFSLAVSQNHLPAAKVMLESLEGKDDLRSEIINSKDLNKFSPIHVAVLRKNIDMVKLLLRNGALPSIIGSNRFGETPFSLAYTQKDSPPEILHALIEATPVAERQILLNQPKRPNTNTTPLNNLELFYRTFSNSSHNYLANASILIAHGANKTQLSDELRQQVENYVTTQHRNLVNPEATEEQVKEAIQLLQTFPSEGNDDLWKRPTEQCKTFLNSKAEELVQTELCDDGANTGAILKRVLPYFQSSIPNLDDNLRRLGLKQLATCFQNEGL